MPSSYLWSEPEAIGSRYERSAAALAAVAQTLESSPETAPSAREFLQYYRALAAAPAERFTEIWTDPYAYFWVRMAYELLVVLRTGTAPTTQAQAYCRALGDLDPSAALDAHLSQFKRLMLALHYHAGVDVEFHTALRVTLPFAIPATPLSIDGRGHVEIHALRDSTLRFTLDGRVHALALGATGNDGPDDGPRLHSCPIVTHGGCALRLQAHAFNNLPGMDFTASVLDAGAGFHRQHAPWIEAALRKIERFHPRSFGEIRDRIALIGLKPVRSGNYTNLTHSDLPGAFVVAVNPNPYELADTLIHEYHHNRLFFIEAAGALLVRGSRGAASDDTYFYSPWRNDPRPLRGLLHALYVYLPVSEFWLRVLEDAATEPTVRNYARERTVRTRVQLDMALHQLATHARLTEHGAQVFEALRRDTDALRELMLAAGDARAIEALVCRDDGTIAEVGPGDNRTPLDVATDLRNHVQRVAPADQREALLEKVPAAGF